MNDVAFQVETTSTTKTFKFHVWLVTSVRKPILVVTVLRKKGGEVRREPLVWLTSPLEVRAGQHLTRYCALVGPPFVSAATATATATGPSARRAANRDRIGQTERNDTNLNLGTAMLTAELLPPQSWSAIAFHSHHALSLGLWILRIYRTNGFR